jgi:tetratricopeptide (TPR) repeat protein
MNEEPREITNPFPGLRPFETGEYRLFFGREGQSDELIVRLGRARFLAVVGTSGSGKSSLVRAGLLPALRGGMMAGAGAGWRIAVMRPGGDPVGNFARALAERGVLDEAGGGLPPAEAKAVIEATLRAGSLGLVEAVRHARIGAQEKLLVIVDQFEELFRFRAARAASNTGDDAAAFVKLLLEAASRREQNIYVALTMRSDFLGDCSQFQGLPEAINEGQYLIPRMNRDERRSAIKGPVGVARGKMSEPLVNRLLNDVGDNPDQLPILQHALMRTWDYWKANRRAGEPLGLEDYEAIGTMENALSRHADEAFEELHDGRSRKIAELLFKALTERGSDNREIRRPTRLSEVCAITGASAEEVAAVVEVFRKEGRSFLMPPAEVTLTHDTVLDISHESLIRNWVRLKGWVSDEAQSVRVYKRVAEAAVLNRKGEEGLLQEPGLSLALDWREKSKPNAAWGRRYHPEFDTAVAYLEESREAHEATLAEIERRKQEETERARRELEQTLAFAEQQARSARRLRWAAAAMALLFVLSLGGGVYAFAMKQFAQSSYESAVKATDEAVRARARAEDEKLRAEGLARSLSAQKDELVIAQAESDKQAKLALDRAKEAEDSKKKALAAQDNAEKAEEAARSDRDKAKQASDEAIAAKKTAVENLKKAEAANKRSDLTIAGFESSVRDLPKQASDNFDMLVREIDITTRQAGDSLSAGEVRELKLKRGWALAHLGAEQLKSGDLSGAKDSFEVSRGIYEADLAAAPQRDALPDPFISDMYHGLGQTYHNIALKGGGEAKKYFEQAEGVFLPALERQKAQFERVEQAAKNPEVMNDDTKASLVSFFIDEGAKQVNASHLALARLYRDMDRRKDAASHLSELIEFQKKRGNVGGLVAARKELAEFYRDQNLFLGAEKAYNELIDEQEARVVAAADYERRGPELAESYNELAEVYRAQDKNEKRNKAEDAFAAANAIQRLAIRLRRIRATRNAQDLDMKADSSDDPADAAADAYLKLAKPARALALYEYARGVREKGAGAIRRDLWKSYDKLTRLYRRKDFKDFAEAERYNQLLIQEVAVTDPKNTKAAADAVALCAELYAKEPGRYSEAVSYHERALKLYEAQEKRDWMSENKSIYALFELYGKLKQPAEQKRAALRRLELLSSEMDRTVGMTGALPKGSITLVYEYANAASDAAYFHLRDKNVGEADAVFRKAFGAYDFVTKRIYFGLALESYATMLDNYARLLVRQSRQDDAAKVAAAAKGVRVKQDETNNIQEQQKQQGASQPPAGQ